MPPEQVVFTEEQYASPRAASPMKGLTSWVVKQGLAKDEKEASGRMLLVAIISIGIAFAAPLILGSGKDGTLSPQERQRLEASTAIPAKR